MKDKLPGEIMPEFAALRSKTCSYLTDDNDENKRVKDTSKCVIKRKLEFEYYENFLVTNHLEKEIMYLEKYLLNKLTKLY